MKPSEVMTKARELVAAGWTQGISATKVGGVQCYCAGGAIGHVLTGDADAIYYENAASEGPPGQLEKFANEILGFENRYDIVIYVNDGPDNTKETVLAWFDSHISRLVSEGK